MTVKPLKWEWNDGFWFAHASEGLWAIEQLRGRFNLSLRLRATREDQDMGAFPSTAKAKSSAARSHRVIAKLEGG